MWKKVIQCCIFGVEFVKEIIILKLCKRIFQFLLKIVGDIIDLTI